MKKNQFWFLFSTDLVHFDEISDTKHKHHYGGLASYENKLVAIAGLETYSVEIISATGGWNDTTIPKVPVGTNLWGLYDFSSVTIRNGSICYIFGMF